VAERDVFMKVCHYGLQSTMPFQGIQAKSLAGQTPKRLILLSSWSKKPQRNTIPDMDIVLRLAHRRWRKQLPSHLASDLVVRSQGKEYVQCESSFW
jgi:hypothetical protein